MAKPIQQKHVASTGGCCGEMLAMQQRRESVGVNCSCKPRVSADMAQPIQQKHVASAGGCCGEMLAMQQRRDKCSTGADQLLSVRAYLEFYLVVPAQ